MLEISGFESRVVINDTAMLYIMKKFPNLIDFKISEVRGMVQPDIHNFEAPTASTALPVETTLQFFNYVSSIKSFFVDPIVTKENTIPVIKRFCSSTFNNADSIKFPTLRMQFDVYDESGEELQPVVTLDNLIERTINVDFNKSSIGDGLDNVYLVEQTGQYFKKYHFKIPGIFLR